MRKVRRSGGINPENSKIGLPLGSGSSQMFHPDSVPDPENIRILRIQIRVPVSSLVGTPCVKLSQSQITYKLNRVKLPT